MSRGSKPGHGLLLFLVVAILILAYFAAYGLFPGMRPSEIPLDRGTAWLARKQHLDGAWRGEEIAVLRPGPAMTAFVLYAFTRLPKPLRSHYADCMDRAVRYLEVHISPEGMVGMEPTGSDYPNYATALTVLCFVALRPAGWEEPVARMVDYLKRAQLDESEGWEPENPEYGGWGFGGPPRPKPDAHRLDISSTRFALEALAAAQVPVEDPVWARARKFLAGCQNPEGDGGFAFTPLADQNKAGAESDATGKVHLFGYGSATADGWLALRFAGADQDRYDRAMGWIRRHFSASQCPGFRPDAPRPWAQGLLGYWLAAAARVLSVEHRPRIRESIESRQRPDGSWVNDVDVMLENEPLLATALAVLAISESMR
ncbi:MAG TPA: prenyltransferase/squalene oxidase repeat-containing protein [Planctomycetota bacterium]